MAHPVDVHVGLRLRQRRWAKGLTQQQLAERVGVRFQQIQKYETGENRVSASRLWEIATVLEVPVGYFFEGLDHMPSGDDARSTTLTDREALSLVRAYFAIPEDKRRRLLDLARVLGDLDRPQFDGAADTARAPRLT